jgi:hypothetical protein
MDDFTSTRRSLHGVAELLLAGPQFRRSGTIRLKAADDGFGTVAEPRLAVAGDLLTLDGRPVRPLSGATLADLAAAAGVDCGAPAGLYTDGSGLLPADTLRIEPQAARTIARAFADGDAALRRLSPGCTPVLWPEHFDLGITLDEVNYGVSPGDSSIPEPYAYVGPWTPREGPFWNAPFGASRPLAQLAGPEALADFFQEGLLQAGKSD